MLPVLVAGEEHGHAVRAFVRLDAHHDGEQVPARRLIAGGQRGGPVGNTQFDVHADRLQLLRRDYRRVVVVLETVVGDEGNFLALIARLLQQFPGQIQVVLVVQALAGRRPR